MEAWVYPESPNDRRQVISTDNTTFDWSILHDGGTWHVFTGLNDVDTGFSAEANTWQHVAAVFIPGTGVRFYKNGQEVATLSIDFEDSPNDNGGDANVTIGQNPAFGGTEFFDGLIDEVTVYGRPLSAAEILAVYLAGSQGKCQNDADGDGVLDPDDGCPGTPQGTLVNAAGCPDGQCMPPPTNMVSWWPGDGTPDDIQGSNHGVLIGNLGFAPGQVGQAFSFDGVDDYVELPASFPNVVDFTFSAWVHWSGGAAFQRIFDFGQGFTNSPYMFLTPRDSSDQLRFAITNNGPGSETHLKTALLPAGQWVHVAVTLEGDTGRLWVNGELKDTQTITLNPSDVVGANTWLGRSQNHTADPLFDGLLDEVTVYDRALSAAEIHAISLAASAGKCKN